MAEVYASGIARKVVASFSKLNIIDESVQLTPRENKILELLATGKMNKSSGRTSNKWRNSKKNTIIIMKKQVNTRVEAVNLFLKR
jgi:DNA-binding NarL/FixJ family response regulator